MRCLKISTTVLFNPRLSYNVYKFARHDAVTCLWALSLFNSLLVKFLSWGSFLVSSLLYILNHTRVLAFVPRPSPRPDEGQVGLRAAEVGDGSPHHSDSGLVADPRPRGSRSLRGVLKRDPFLFQFSRHTRGLSFFVSPVSPTVRPAGPLPSFAWTSYNSSIRCFATWSLVRAGTSL